MNRASDTKNYAITRFLGMFLLVCMALGAWIYASPKGAEPDGAFHLVSIWCGSGYEDSQCEPVTNHRGQKLEGRFFVPASIAQDFGNSDTQSLNNKMAVNHRNNSIKLYPKGYYWVTSKFVQSNVERTVLILRWINVVLFAVCALFAFCFLPENMKKGFGLSILVLTMPLGLFTVVSNNPSSWTITGLATYWAFLYAYLTAKENSRKMMLAGAFALFSALIGLISRGDSGGYLVLSTLAVLAIVYTRRSNQEKILKRRLILPIGVVLSSLALFTNASQNKYIVQGFIARNGIPGKDPAASVEFSTTELVFNLTRLPGVFAGFFGLEGTNGFLGGVMAFTMPDIVSLGMLFLFASLISSSNSLRSKIELLIFSLFSAAVAALPIIVENRTGELLPGIFQSRYMLPIAFPLVGLFMAGSQIEYKMVMSKSTKNLVFVILNFGYVFALHTSMRKFVLPANSIGLNLNQSQMWWRQGVPSPMTILFLGSLSYLILLYFFVYGDKKIVNLHKVVFSKNH